MSGPDGEDVGTPAPVRGPGPGCGFFEFVLLFSTESRLKIFHRDQLDRLKILQYKNDRDGIISNVVCKKI
jgi:hypothetical protein